MEHDEFEWHEPKRAINLEKHGIDFEDAIGIWAAPVATRRSAHATEARFITLGLLDGRVIVVVWTSRSQRRRLISARRAKDHERNCYTAFVERGGQRPH